MAEITDTDVAQSNWNAGFDAARVTAAVMEQNGDVDTLFCGGYISGLISMYSIWFGRDTAIYLLEGALKSLRSLPDPNPLGSLMNIKHACEDGKPS